jgi:hypothetical protein
MLKKKLSLVNCPKQVLGLRSPCQTRIASPSCLSVVQAVSLRWLDISFFECCYSRRVWRPGGPRHLGYHVPPYCRNCDWTTQHFSNNDMPSCGPLWAPQRGLNPPSFWSLESFGKKEIPGYTTTNLQCIRLFCRKSKTRARIGSWRGQNICLRLQTDFFCYDPFFLGCPRAPLYYCYSYVNIKGQEFCLPPAFNQDDTNVM